MSGNETNITDLMVDHAAEIQALEDNTDAFFVVIISIIIFFMQCGFAFLEAGSVRSKNTTNILLKNLLDSFIGCIIYWAIGYALAFGDGGPFIGGSSSFGWFGTALGERELKFNWFFHFVFAATACTIISGSVAERCDIWPYFIYSTIITGIVYPVVSRWAWADAGWLANGAFFWDDVTYQDFAGSGVVHLTGGIAALFGAYFCGPRIGRFSPANSTGLPGHSTPLAALGAFILVFGFFAFNGGSQGAISNKGDGDGISNAILSTIISGSAGALTNMFLAKIVGYIQQVKHGESNIRSSWSLLTTINGALVGMVAICAGCNETKMWAAFVIGIISSFFYFGISMLLVKLKIDDPLEAVAVHGGGGMWGVLAAPLFTKTGTVCGQTLAVNLIAMVSIIAWSACWSCLIFGILYALKILRIPVEMEMKGMDITKHGEPAYPIPAWKEAWFEVFSSPAKQKSSSKLVSALINLGFEPDKETTVDGNAGDHSSTGSQQTMDIENGKI